MQYWGQRLSSQQRLSFSDDIVHLSLVFPSPTTVGILPKLWCSNCCELIRFFLQRWCSQRWLRGCCLSAFVNVVPLEDISMAKFLAIADHPGSSPLPLQLSVSRGQHLEILYYSNPTSCMPLLFCFRYVGIINKFE